MTSLKGVITEILLSRDFEISEEQGCLLGRRGEVEAIFCLLPQFDEDEADLFLERYSDFQGRRIVATLDRLPGPVVESLEPQVYIWDREAIEREIGRTRIERIVGEEDHGLVDEIWADDYPRMISPRDLESLECGDVGEKIVRPMLDMNDVKEISRQTVGGFRHRLELVPYYVFGYSCSLYVNGESFSSKEGTLSVNALTKKVERWRDDFETVDSVELNHQRMEPMIDSEEASRLVREEVVRVHTYERELIREEGHATVMERETLSPSSEEISLRTEGIFYLPIWCVEGVHGVMIINAGTGKIISEDYYRE
ncbi:MAG: hypothetical protein ACLFUV_00700 [Methanomassiliicoccales archaeon]